MGAQALAIHPDGTLTELPDLELETFQEAVGGYIQMIALPGAYGFCWEEAKIRGNPPPPNHIATRLLHEAGGAPDDYIAGTFVVAGRADDEGDQLPITPEWEAFLRGASDVYIREGRWSL